MLRILLLAKIHAYWMVQMMNCRRHLSLYFSEKSVASDDCQFHRHICRLTVDSLFGYSLLTAILFAIYLWRVVDQPDMYICFVEPRWLVLLVAEWQLTGCEVIHCSAHGICQSIVLLFWQPTGCALLVKMDWPMGIYRIRAGLGWYYLKDEIWYNRTNCLKGWIRIGPTI